MAAAPAPTSAGVFGMARTTGTPAPAASSRRAMVTPAAIDSTLAAPAVTAAPGRRRHVARLHRDHHPVGCERARR